MGGRPRDTKWPPPPGTYWCRSHKQFLPLADFAPSAASQRRRHTLCRACTKLDSAQRNRKPRTRELRLLCDTQKGTGYKALTIEKFRLVLAEHGWRCVCTGARYDPTNQKGKYLVLVRVEGTQLLAPCTRERARMYGWTIPKELYWALRRKNHLPLQAAYEEIIATAATPPSSPRGGAAAEVPLVGPAAKPERTPGDSGPDSAKERAEMSPHAQALADQWSSVLMRRLEAARRLHAGRVPGAQQQPTRLVRKGM